MHITKLDAVVITLFLLAIYIIAWRSRKAVTTSTDVADDQYLAGRSLTVFESLCSIIATEVSALTFLGAPAFCYSADFSFAHIYVGALFGRIIIAQVFLPLIYGKGLTVYSIMGKFGTVNGQRLTAISYAINKFLAVGVRLFSGSILIAEYFQLSIYTALTLIAFLTFLYTLVGGLKAVVRTDVVQMFIFILGGIVAHYLIVDVDGRSWGELMSIASTAGKTHFFSWDRMGDFAIGVFGGILFDMATHGVDQDFAQRLMANRTMRGGQIAIVVSSFFSLAVGLLFLSIGALLWSHYQVHTPPQLPADQLFAHFISNYFPDGLRGFIVSGVIAATMSTLDSTINALSATFFSDIFRHKSLDQKRARHMSALDTLVITLGLLLVAFVASKSDGLLLLGLKITSWTAGSLVCLFMAILVFTKIRVRLDALTVLGVYGFGLAGVYANTYLIQGPWQFNVYYGCAFGFIFIFLRKLASR